jgi:hypothetical protein
MHSANIKEDTFMERIAKKAFCVIGKVGSTDDGEGFIQKLWNEANSHFDEVAEFAKKDENGNLCGVWGIMTDPKFSFQPWTENFTKGFYLAGVEVETDSVPPKGWKKWIVPGYEYLKVPMEGPETFRKTLDQMKADGLELVGAVHDFTDPVTKENYMLFPIVADDSKRELIMAEKAKHYQIAPCGFNCNACFLSEWCGGCRSTCNMCSFATISENNACENAACSKEKNLEGCYDCTELDDCKKGFFSVEGEGIGCKGAAMFIRKHGGEISLRKAEVLKSAKFEQKKTPEEALEQMEKLLVD